MSTQDAALNFVSLPNDDVDARGAVTNCNLPADRDEKRLDSGAVLRPAGLQLLPAVDVKAGQAVRLTRGRVDTDTSYGSALSAAQYWQTRAGVIHLVDLDRAFGVGNNQDILASVIEKMQVPVQLSGGIDNPEALTWALKTGAQRIVVACSALQDIDWVQEIIGKYGQRLVIGLDVRADELWARGKNCYCGKLWKTLEILENAFNEVENLAARRHQQVEKLTGTPTQNASQNVSQSVPQAAFSGVETAKTLYPARYVVTETMRDGMMSGAPLELLKDIAAQVTGPLIASGGVGSLDDIAQIRKIMPAVNAVILGKALYKRAFSFTQALEVAGGSNYRLGGEVLD